MSFLLDPFQFAGTSDPYFSSVVLLCGFNGTDASTSFDDESTANHGLTAQANAQIDTAQSMFGGSSLLLDGSGDRVTSTDSNDWTPSGAYTWEGWCRPAASGAETCLISHYHSTGTQNSWGVNRESSNTLKFIWISGTNTFNSISSTDTLPQDVWTYWAVTWDGTTARMFINGVLQGTTGSVTTFLNRSTVLRIGNMFTSAIENLFWNGWLDEIRLTQGVCRYTATFTVPTAAFPRS